MKYQVFRSEELNKNKNKFFIKMKTTSYLKKACDRELENAYLQLHKAKWKKRKIDSELLKVC